LKELLPRLINKQKFFFQIQWITDASGLYTSVIQWTWKMNLCLYMRPEGVLYTKTQACGNKQKKCINTNVIAMFVFVEYLL
jgi:hypothetical protein